jgi:hypothetical protein
MRRARRAFHPSPGEGTYRLPHPVRDRLTTALAPYRNRDAAFTLATFLARFWSAPRRIVGSFPVDRRALANHPDLGLTEAQVRGATRALEEVGFLDRALASGSPYQPTPDGLHRKPILFVFGAEYAPLFLAVNRRAARARTKSPKNKSEAKPQVLMGEIRRPPPPTSLNPNLEAALDRWKKAAEGQGLLRSDQRES